VISVNPGNRIPGKFIYEMNLEKIENKETQ
jgi:hypothetical protein